MIITKDFIFIHVPKTGGKTVTKIIKNNLGPGPLGWAKVAREQGSSHVPIRTIDKYYDNLKPGWRHIRRGDQKFTFCTVRNPWDWYISYYFYTRVYERDYWQHLIEKKELSIENFNNWVINLLNNRYLNTFEKYGKLGYSKRFKHMKKFDIGLYSQMNMDYCFSKRLDEISSIDKEKYKKLSAVDRECRLEHLKEDLFRMFEEYNIKLDNYDIPYEQRTIRPYPFNQLKSQNRKIFYSPDAAKLVFKKDNIMIENNGYKF